MQGSAILDIVLLVILAGSLITGLRQGLIRSVSGVAGLVTGGVAAFFAIPLVNTWVTAAEWRVAAVMVTIIVLLGAGAAVGAAVGRVISSPVRRGPLSVIDRLLGGVANVVVAGLVMALVAFSLGSMGIPVLSPAISSSRVLQTIDSVTPDPVTALIAQLRSTLLDEGLPRLAEVFTGPLPDTLQADLDNPALAEAALSVARISGTAFSCGKGQVGSGFVLTEDRILTNAHVVAGVADPVVETPGRAAVTGTVVYFDAVADLAVIEVDGLGASPLPLSPTLPVGSAAVTQGFPFGGPFQMHAAQVVAVGTLLVDDIYGTSPAPRSVYTLASTVQPGNSGGPVLTETGEVAGVVFAKGATTEGVGFAVTMEEVLPVAASAPLLDEPVSSGRCIP